LSRDVMNPRNRIASFIFFLFVSTCFSMFTVNYHLQAELGKPSILHPDKGKVNIFVDCSPTAEPTFEVGDLF
jgi:hypothetical protein